MRNVRFWPQTHRSKYLKTFLCALLGLIRTNNTSSNNFKISRPSGFNELHSLIKFGLQHVIVSKNALSYIHCKYRAVAKPVFKISSQYV